MGKGMNNIVALGSACLGTYAPLTKCLLILIVIWINEVDGASKKGNNQG
jgi:hypothetical protein